MATTIGCGLRLLRLFMRERNTSQLPRLLCCTIEKKIGGTSACEGPW